MIYKSKTYNWQGEEIYVEVNGVVRTKIKDVTQISGTRDTKLDFKSWTEIKGPDLLSLAKLYQDTFPEFVKTEGGKIKLKIEEVKEMFPGTVFIFDYTDEDLFVEKKESEMGGVSKVFIAQLKEEIKVDLKKELRAEILKDVLVEISRKMVTEELQEVSPDHTILRKDRNGAVLCGYVNIAHAVRETGINKSSISQAIKGTIKSAGGFLWEKKF